MRRPTDSDVTTLAYGATSPLPYTKLNPHAGVDYRARPVGQNIYAPHAGKVTVSGDMGKCGQAVEIDGGRFRSRLCHNSVLKVNKGEDVKEGSVVALSGATGGTNSVHCHWILWDNGVRVDGSIYVNDNGGGMHDKFTEEDAIYWSDYFGLPKDWFMDYVDKNLRDAIFSILSKGSKLDNELKINEGDVGNYDRMYGIDSGNYLRQLHKKLLYDLDKLLPGSDGDIKVLPPGKYKVN